jgi:formylglycine-generating enzyme required for sulfatase activity
LLPFPAPPNTREVKLDVRNYLITLVADGEPIYDNVTIGGGSRITKVMKVPVKAAAAAPATGTLKIVADAPVRVTVAGGSREVRGAEETFSLAFGTHKVRVEAAGFADDREIVLSRENPVERLVYVVGSRTTPAAAPAAIGGDVRWVPLRGGSITVGCAAVDKECEADERPAKQESVTAFQIMASEVTVGQYEEWLKKERPTAEISRPAWLNALPIGDAAMHPVVNVSWNDAVAFCRSVQGQLPSEAEWEFAARQGLAGSIFGWDPAASDPAPVRQSGPGSGAAAVPQTGLQAPAARSPLPGNFADETAGKRFSGWTFIKGYEDGYAYSAPVASFRSLGGIYDLAGNVWEWTQGEIAGEKVLRGGSFSSPLKELRISNRFALAADKGQQDVGFRCVKR